PPDDQLLLLACTVQRQGEAHEERLGAAVPCSGHRLREPDHGISASKRAATSLQESPFWCATASRCCFTQSASSVSSATADVTKVSSSAATLPVIPSSTRSGSEPRGITTAGRPSACASATARQNVSFSSPR